MLTPCYSRHRGEEAWNPRYTPRTDDGRDLGIRLLQRFMASTSTYVKGKGRCNGPRIQLFLSVRYSLFRQGLDPQSLNFRAVQPRCIVPRRQMAFEYADKWSSDVEREKNVTKHGEQPDPERSSRKIWG